MRISVVFIVLVLFCCVVFSGFSGNANPQKQERPVRSNSYQIVDQIALSIPTANSSSIENLANYIQSKSTDELSKARMIFRWMTKNIKYDEVAYSSGMYRSCDAQSVFKSKQSVCAGFSNLFKAIAEKCGLESEVIHGYAKGYGYKPGKKFKETDHAWNKVKINGQWKLLDVTWGEGYCKSVNGKLKAVKKLNDFYFCTDPYAFLFDHYPQNKADLFITDNFSKVQYENLQFVEDDLFILGLDAKTIFTKSLQEPAYRAPIGYDTDFDLKVVKLNDNRRIKPAVELSIEIESKENLEIAFINNGQWTDFTKENGKYTGRIVPKKGELSVDVKLVGFDASFYTLLKYQVVTK